jgi:hypothetical protein
LLGASTPFTLSVIKSLNQPVPAETESVTITMAINKKVVFFITK